MATNAQRHIKQVLELDTAFESTRYNIRDPAASGHHPIHIVADSRRLHAQLRQSSCDASMRPACTCRCHPALLISNAFSKPVHVVTDLPEEAVPLCVSNEVSPLLHESLMVMQAGPLQFIPHYSTDELEALRAPALARLQVEPANARAASNCSSSSLVHEAAQTATNSSEEVTPGGVNDYTINIVVNTT